MEKRTRKPIYLTQEEYDEMVQYLLSAKRSEDRPQRVQQLPKDQRSKWLTKAKDKFKVEEGEGLGLPNGIGLYQQFTDPIHQTPVWKLHVAPSDINTILHHFHPHSNNNAAAIGAHSGVRSTYNKVIIPPQTNHCTNWHVDLRVSHGHFIPQR